MTSYLLRRALVAVLLVFVVSSTALLLTRLVPGDFTSEQIDLDPATRARMRADAGLDQPVLQQYVRWVGGALRLDFGRSLVYSRPVLDMVRERFVNTAILAFTALVLATLIGVPLGVISGSGPGALSRAIRLISIVLLSVPPLVASLVMVLIAARTGWWAFGGMTSWSAADLSWSTWLADVGRHVPVPLRGAGAAVRPPSWSVCRRRPSRTPWSICSCAPAWRAESAAPKPSSCTRGADRSVRCWVSTASSSAASSAAPSSSRWSLAWPGPRDVCCSTRCAAAISIWWPDASRRARWH